METLSFIPRPPHAQARRYAAEDSREQGWILSWLLSFMNPGVTLVPDEDGDGFTINSSPDSADAFSIHVSPGEWILLFNSLPEVVTWEDLNRRFVRIDAV